MSAQRWTLSEIREAFVNGGPPDAGFVLAADYERDVAAAEVQSWNAAVRQLAGEGCTWADGDCPNGTDCLSCKNLDALITERAKGDREGWNAAVEAVISACQADWRFEDHNDWYLDAVAALRKPTEAQT